MKQRFAELVFILFACILFLGATYFVVDNYITSSSDLNVSGEHFVALNRQSAKARITDPSKNSSIYFRFTANQKVHFANLIKSNGSASLVAVIKSLEKNVKNKSGLDLPFEFGFLYMDEAENSISPGANIASGNWNFLYEEAKSCVALSLSVAQVDVIPDGFFLRSKSPCAFDSVKMKETAVGFDFSTPVPFYGFGNNGGEVKAISTDSFDFSCASKLFSQKNTSYSVLPKITVSFEPCEDVGTWNNQKRVSFSYGGENIVVRRSTTQDKMVIQLSAFSKGHGAAGFEELSFGKNSNVSSIIMTANDVSTIPSEGKVLKPFVTDLGFIVDWPVSEWRCKDFELFEWEQVPHVLFFDFIDYDTQSQFLTRLAYFAEKEGYKGTLVSDDFILSHHGYNAHDYKDEDLAAFFTLAHRKGFALNSKECLLRDILLENGIIIANGDGSYKKGIGAIVSFSRESLPYLRWQFMAHESWHGIYFTSQEFRDFVEGLYTSFDKKSMDFIQTFWATQPGLNYDTKDDYLMRNEFMAYIMQQTYPNIASYFVSLANRDSVNRIEGPLAQYVRETGGLSFQRAGEKLNQWAFDTYGFAAGRVNLVYRQDPN